MGHPAIPYVAAFAAFMAFLILERAFSLDVAVLYPIRATVTSTLLILLSRSVVDRKSTRLNSSHIQKSRMPSSA